MTYAINVNADLFRIVYGTVSTEETRYYLNGILVEPHPCGGVFLVSTDGHRMTVVHDESGHADKPMIIRLSKDALKACKPKRIMGTRSRAGLKECRRLYVDDKLATITTVDVNDKGEEFGDAIIAATSANAVIDGTFPDWRRVIPRQADDDASIADHFDARYISGFADMALELGAKSMVAVSHQKGAPALIRFAGIENAFGILMPMRGAEGDLILPAFLNAQPVVADSETVSETVPDTVASVEPEIVPESIEPEPVAAIGASPPVAPSFKVPLRLLTSTGMSRTPSPPPVAPSCVLRIVA